MRSLSIFLVATLVLGISCLPSRVRRQFDWAEFEDSNLDTIRIPRQGGRWGGRNPNWNRQTGRQQPSNNFDNFGLSNLDNNFNQGNGLNNGVTNAGSTANDATTRSPVAYRNCMSLCQYTHQYNPVCGTDGNTYSNSHELDCAVSCGRNIQTARGGTCQPA